jgi:hypothetical protein
MTPVRVITYHPFLPYDDGCTRSNVPAASLFVALRDHIITTYNSGRSRIDWYHPPWCRL